MKKIISFSALLAILSLTSFNTMAADVCITYGNNQQLTVASYQLFMTSNGKLVPADKLVPGKSQIIDKSGNVVIIEAITLGACIN